METTLFMQSGPLRLSWTTGAVYLETGDEAEHLGHIEDPDAEPWEFAEDWSNLLDRWRDATGHAIEAERAFYYGINPSRAN